MNDLRVALFLLCAGMAVPVAPGQSKIVPDQGRLQAQMKTTPEFTLNFPDYVDGGGWSIQLALSNLDPSRNASVVVTAYDPQGREVAGLFGSGSRFEIPARGSRVLRSAGAGSAARRGWIEVKSETDSVRGLLTYRQTGTGIEVGVEPVRLRDHFALFVEESSSIGTGLAIFKPETASEIEFRIRDEAGTDPLGEVLTRGDFRQRGRTLAEWFQGTDPEFLRGFRGLLFLRTVAGSSFAPLGLRFGKRQGSLSAVPVIPIVGGVEGRRLPHSSQVPTVPLYFPDYVEGEGWSVQLVLGNLSPDRSVPVVVEVYDSSGQSVSAFFDSENSFEIPPLGSRLLRSTGAGVIRRGWIEINADPVMVPGLLTYRNALTGIEVGVDSVGLGDHFALFVEESTDIGTGLAILKPDSSSEIEFRIRDKEGRDPLGGVVTPREDFHQRARTIPEWFDVEGVDQGFPRDFQGLLFLRAADGSSFAPVGLRFGKRQGSLSAVPVIPLVAGSVPELTQGLPERPFVNTTVGGNRGSTRTVGTLRLGLNPNAFPVIVRESENWTDVLVAGSQLGKGRIIAFSGQDFLGPDDRATLLGNANADRLVANAVRWAGREAGSVPLRVLVDNPRIADALQAQGLEGAEVVGRRGQYQRDWSASALDDVDVVVVLTNYWHKLTLAPEFVPPLHAFVERGGGLVIAGSALHWEWWIRKHFGRFTGDALLEGAGISWNSDSIEEIGSASTDVDLSLAPGAVWGAYIAGERLDARRMALLPGLFSSALELGRTKELDAALARLVAETPELPTSSAAPEARLAAEIGETLGPYEWPKPHPWAAAFPGLPAQDAHRADGAATVDATRGEFPADASRRERHLPLGFYAPPSTLVTIEVPDSHATGELRVSVGELYDNLGEYTAQAVWRRAPDLRREFPVVDRNTSVTNAYGGSIALIVPDDYYGAIPITVRGAIPMAVYTAGRSSAGDWFADLNAGAPQAIIQKPGGIRFVISAERAHGITDPGEVSEFWDGFLRHHADLAGEPVPRAFESIWIFDPQVGHGYANAGPIRINYPLHGEHWVLVPGTAEGREWLATLPSQGPTPHRIPPTGYSPAAHGVDWWLFGHELGHQWQTEDWTGHGITEVGVNLFTMYTLNYYIYGGDDFNVYTENRNHGCAAPVDHAALANLRWPTSGACERLFVYRQLIAEFGWDAMKQVFHSYYDPAYPRSVYGGSLDGFAIRFSAIVRRDLVAFFRHWEYPLSRSAEATIRSFGLEEWLPPGW